MRRLISWLLSTALAATLAATVISAAPAPTSAAVPAQAQVPRCAHNAVGLIAAKWRSLNAERGPMGCPVGPERDIAGRRGRVSTFEHGEIVWSPDQGRELVVAVYQRNRDVVADWGTTAPFRYDFFLVRWDVDGRNGGQREIRGRVQGSTVIVPRRDGVHSVVVEGCVSRLLRSARCSQRWTAPASVAVKLPPVKPPLEFVAMGASQGGDRVDLSWRAVEPAWQYYKVHWALAGTAAVTHESRGAGFSVQLPPGTRAGTGFTFWVRGCRKEKWLFITTGSYCGSWSPGFSGRTTADVAAQPARPTSPKPGAPGQNPAPGAGGISRVSIYNCHTYNRPVHVWVYDRTADGAVSLQDRGELQVQYEHPDNDPLRGACPADGSEPITLEFADGHVYGIVIVDPGRSGCSGNEPDVQDCRLEARTVVGDSHGAVAPDWWIQ